MPTQRKFATGSRCEPSFLAEDAPAGEHPAAATRKPVSMITALHGATVRTGRGRLRVTAAEKRLCQSRGVALVHSRALCVCVAAECLLRGEGGARQLDRSVVGAPRSGVRG